MENFAELRKKYKAEIDEMCLMDDNFMSAVLQDKACCELVLRIILNRDDIEVLECKTQYSLSNLHGRAVRLDVFAKDKNGEYMNIEVQRNDKDAVPQRARFNSSLIDANVVEKGSEFKDLPETYIIFITENDILGKGLPLYTINRTIAETGEIFDDKSHIIYVNSQITDDTALGRLMSDFKCKKPEEMNYDVLSDITKITKEREDEKGMCKIIDDIVQRECKKARIDTAIRMIDEGIFTVEQIAKISNLSVSEVEELIKKRSA
ncbi:MAG: PD-(D/E)XK nuclease family transposase [[Eubacterium] saphenum]|nr:PD-(D/E)XK nuclease family transposase [[Eubacterium] saphenum]